jgi:hypothetical protein
LRTGRNSGSCVLQVATAEKQAAQDHPQQREAGDDRRAGRAPGAGLNLVECWFSVLSRKALTNTSFTSVAELETRIDCWVSHWNDNPEPFVWTKPADEILDKVARGQAALDRITKFGSGANSVMVTQGEG